MRTGLATPIVIALTALAAWPAVAQSAADYTGDVVLFLHRDGSITATPPNATSDAVMEFGLLPPHSFNFTTTPLMRNWTLRGPGTLVLTVTSAYSVLGRLNATLTSDGVPIARTESSEFLIDGREQELALAFDDLHGQVPVGKRVGLVLELTPIAYVDLIVGPQVNLVDLKVDILFDSQAHRGGLHVLGSDPASPMGTGPGGPGGNGSPGSSGGSGGNGNPDGGTSGTGTPGQPITLLGSAPVPPGMVLMGLGTSGIVTISALALRGRYGFG
ncbi:MAG: hypothetical protein LC624_00755 [Halobacteriales archaeon]|nr:hypothetical protein [Halobacteriales archaeon]